jgi:CDP-glucose 4,6-dehydratase
MHFLVTGHTGFKGAWLTLWLTSMGHRVSGISLDPVPGSLYDLSRVTELVSDDFRIDIRNADEVKTATSQTSPDVVIHMAAQPLVRESYRDPRYTFETNVMGTLNVIEAASSTKSVRAHVVVTTDKVYRNVNQVTGYVESDPLGGFDPYSSSKAMADLLAQSWQSSFPGTPMSVVRAGNVIGGGDNSKDRLMPDLINSYLSGKPPVLRYPNSVRPWQHVLDCLNGYIMVTESLLSGNNHVALNIGPDEDSFVSVADVSNQVRANLAVEVGWTESTSNNPHEAELLSLDASAAKSLLGWSGKLKFLDAVKWTTDWYVEVAKGHDFRDVTLSQIDRFLNIKPL